MPSGFIILHDGRCFAPRWVAYDDAIRAIMRQLPDTDQGTALRVWLESLIPAGEDTATIGYGPWLRARDEKIIARYIDLRCVTPENQNLIEDAVLALRDSGDQNVSYIDTLADMIRRCRAGETPLSFSHWSEVVAAPEVRIGPGWKTAEPNTAEQADGKTPEAPQPPN